MRPSLRFTLLALAVLFSACVTTTGAGQTSTNDATSDAQTITPGYARVAPVAADLNQVPRSVLGSDVILEFPANATTSREIFAAGRDVLTNPSSSNGNAASAAAGRNENESFSGVRQSPPGGTVADLDTVPTFAGAFHSPFPSRFPKEFNARIRNGLFPFVMIGNHPLAGGTTVIPAKISTVSLRLLNPDGTVNLEVPFAPFEDLTLDSPNFEEANYRSGHRIQFADAIQRAEFFNAMAEDWHTVLRPRIVNRVTIDVPAFVTVILPFDNKPHAVQAYIIRHRGQPNQLIEILDLLFNDIIFNEVVNEIIAGNYTTNALNTAMFPNTGLFSIDDHGNFAGCCVLGFHTYFFSPGASPEPRWLFQFASWLSPGIFGGGFQDVTALSHETSESFNDPFVNTIVPFWQFPNQPPASHACQGNLETGDPVEVLAAATVPITIREPHEVFTYHPQTEALLQWFEMGTTSNAIDGAFSFPNEGALPHSAVPCPP